MARILTSITKVAKAIPFDKQLFTLKGFETTQTNRKHYKEFVLLILNFKDKIMQSNGGVS